MDKSDLSAELVAAAQAKLSGKEYLLYEFIYLYARQHNAAPDWKRMMEAMDTKSVLSVQLWLSRLVAKEFVFRDAAGKPNNRTLKLRFPLEQNSLIGYPVVPFDPDLIRQAQETLSSDTLFDLYKYLYDYIFTNGVTPSMRTMMRVMDLKSVTPITYRLSRLIERGFIEKTNIGGKRVAIIPKVPLHDGFVLTHE